MCKREREGKRVRERERARQRERGDLGLAREPRAPDHALERRIIRVLQKVLLMGPWYFSDNV